MQPTNRRPASSVNAGPIIVGLVVVASIAGAWLGLRAHEPALASAAPSLVTRATVMPTSDLLSPYRSTGNTLPVCSPVS
jgi:hypothetical protein